MSAEHPRRLGWGRTTVFASGDFAFNLYWQSISLYLLFYYTDALGFSATAAGLIYMAASIWDGIMDPIVGAIADRTHTKRGKYRPYIYFGALPLALAFALLYFHPPLSGAALIVAVAAGHFVFRTLYALVNVPYAALTARITHDATERANISGMRMMFGTLAAVTVALATQPIATFVTGRCDGAAGFFLAACFFAAIATPILFLVFATTREEGLAEFAVHPPNGLRLWHSLLSNRALWTLVVAATFMVACYTVLAKSVLYYFKYVLNDEASASTALAISAGSGLVFIPAWMMLARRLGKRAIWFVASAVFAIGLIAFSALDVDAAWKMNIFLVVMQAGFLGIVFTYWAMLPDTVEYGQWRTGVRAEGSTFGVALLFQKVALGLGAGVFGMALDHVGYRPNQVQTPETLAGIRTIMIVLPLMGVGVAATVMLLNPLRRGAHEAIVADLVQRKTQGDSPQ